MKKWTQTLIAVLAVALASACLFRRKPPQILPSAVRQDVRPARTKEVVSQLASHAPLRREEIEPEDVSESVAVVCGRDAATAGRYEARNATLRSFARRRDLGGDDVRALMGYLRATGGALRVEREAALKNGVLNLLRHQRPVPDELVDLLVEMVEGKSHPSEVVDYCIQHLGALSPDIRDEGVRRCVRRVLASAASDTRSPYAGTALYALAEGAEPGRSSEDEMRRLTVAACGAQANPLARMSALQLAGERGYREVLPIVRDLLDGSRRDAVTDMVAVGTMGLLGGKEDLSRLYRMKERGGQRLRLAVESAIQRIVGRSKQGVRQ